MFSLVSARCVKGSCAVAVSPIATTIVFDIYNKEERAKIQGYLSSVWGISAVTGPLLGGFFVEVLNWRYVFWMNIPLGILAMLGIIFFLYENIEKQKRSIDYIGSALMFIVVSVLMFILVEGGVRIAWNSMLMIVLISVVDLRVILFLFQEKRAIAPMMTFSIL